MAKHDICGPLRPSMSIISHPGLVIITDTTSLKILFINTNIFFVHDKVIIWFVVFFFLNSVFELMAGHVG